MGDGATGARPQTRSHRPGRWSGPIHGLARGALRPIPPDPVHSRIRLSLPSGSAHTGPASDHRLIGAGVTNWTSCGAVHPRSTPHAAGRGTFPGRRGARGGILSSNARCAPSVRGSHPRPRRPRVSSRAGSRRWVRHRGAIRRSRHEAAGSRSSGRARRRGRLPGKSNSREKRRASGCRRGETGRSVHRPDRREGRGGLGLPRLRAHGGHRTASNRSAPLFRTPIPIAVFRRLRNTGPFLLGPFVRPGRRPAHVLFAGRRPAVHSSPGVARFPVPRRASPGRGASSPVRSPDPGPLRACPDRLPVTGAHAFEGDPRARSGFVGSAFWHPYVNLRFISLEKVFTTWRTSCLTSARRARQAATHPTRTRSVRGLGGL